MKRKSTSHLASALSLLALIAVTACEEGRPPETPTLPAATQTDFPWPVPLPSTSMEIPLDLRAPAEPNARLSRAGDWLARALGEAGYRELRWYEVPHGFALVTRLELIDDQGHGMAHPDPAQRFSAEYPPLPFFTMRFWSELLAGRTGRFRLFVFVVIDGPFGYAKDVTDAQITWKHPSLEFPQSRDDLPYKADDKWYALVYEIERAGAHGQVNLVPHPSDPATHLTNAGILAALANEAKAAPKAPPGAEGRAAP